MKCDYCDETALARIQSDNDEVAVCWSHYQEHAATATILEDFSAGHELTKHMREGLIEGDV